MEDVHRSLLDYGSGEASAAVVGDVYVNRRLGLAFRFPAGWIFASAAEVSATAKGRVLDPNDEVFSDVMQLLVDDHLPTISIAAPIDAALVERLGTDEVRPSITVHFDSTCPKPGTWRARRFTLLGHVKEDLRHFLKGVPDYQLLSGPMELTVCGRDAVQYRAMYTYHHQDIPFPIPMREWAVYIARCPSLFEIRMCDFPGLDPALEFDFTAAMESIVVADEPDR